VRVDKNVPTHKVLFLDAHNALDRGEADLAIFQAFLSVEAAIRQVVRTLVIARAIPFSQAWRLVTTNRRQARTFDDVLEMYGNVDHMLTQGLLGLGLNAPDTETPQWQDWQRCRRLRNLISHQGFMPSETDARRCLATAEWLLRDFLNAHLDSMSQSSARDESNSALRSIIPKPSKRFLAYANEILSRRPWRLAFRSLSTHPNVWQRSGPIGWETTGERISVWVDQGQPQHVTESHIARILTFLDFKALGYPRAVVSDHIPWPDQRFGYELAAESLTASVLDLAVQAKVESGGLTTTGLFDDVADRSIDDTLRPDFTSTVGDLLNTYAVRAARVCALSPSKRPLLLAALDTLVPDQAGIARRILAWLDQLTTWDREECLRAMVRVHDETMMLASVLVLDPYTDTRYGRGGGSSLP
jgi:hypothetical protein